MIEIIYNFIDNMYDIMVFLFNEDNCEME